jgi:hypothetical protein
VLSSRTSRTRRAPALAAAAAVALVPLACGDDDRGEDGGAPAAGGAATELPRGDTPVDLDPERFTADVDHPYLPLRPGTRWTYREVDGEGTTLEVVVIATGVTRRIANGIDARVVRDTVRQDGEVVEDTFDWYAQDDEGNVWYLGEDTAEFEDGEITSREGSFEAGVDGAQPGIIMPAEPAPEQRYRQEYLEGEAEDNGQVLSAEERVEVPAGSNDDAVLTKDTNALEPEVLEYKLYARDVGMALALGVSGGGGREELISVDEVGPEVGTGPLGSPRP